MKALICAIGFYISTDFFQASFVEEKEAIKDERVTAKNLIANGYKVYYVSGEKYFRKNLEDDLVITISYYRHDDSQDIFLDLGKKGKLKPFVED